jgi:hypothetical protein
MDKAVLHACDETRDTHVCERVYPLDTARTPFNVLVRHLSEISRGGVWLKPFRGLIPRMPGLPPIEIATRRLEWNGTASVGNHAHGGGAAIVSQRKRT